MKFSASRRRTAKYAALFFLCLPLFNCRVAPAQGAFPPKAFFNVALNSTVTFSSPPNYQPSSDENDLAQLTDGLPAPAAPSFWDKRESVGWNNVWPLQITLDLGRVQPIAGFVINTAAKQPAIPWPTSIVAYGSDDQANWHFFDEIVSSAQRAAKAPATGYAVHRFASTDLHAQARYVRFVVWSEPYFFCDEIEVLRDDETEKAPAEAVAKAVAIPASDLPLHSAIMTRLSRDAATVQHFLDDTQKNENQRAVLQSKLDDARAALREIAAPVAADFRTLLPLNPQHERILAVHGASLRAQQAKDETALRIWKQHRYEYVPFIAMPTTRAAPAVDITLLGNETRADSLLLTNAGSTPLALTLRVAPGTQNWPKQKNWLQLRQVQWTDTREFYPVADALVPLEQQNEGYRFVIPVGVTGKLWIQVNSRGVPAGRYVAKLEISGNGIRQTVPMAIRIANRQMARPRLSLGMYDYTAGTGLYGITEENRAAAIELMASHGVDVTTGVVWKVLPMPQARQFDAAHQLTLPPNYFDSFDEWVAQWSDARFYVVVMGVDHLPNGQTKFADTEIGSPEFDARVSAWVQAISAHLKARNIFEKTVVHFLDEPDKDEQADLITAWTKAFKAAAPTLKVFSNPCWVRPDLVKNQAAFTAVDILCPQLPIYCNGGAAAQEYFQRLRAGGKTLWFYQATGPTRLYDPTRYYRGQAWHAFRHGATGIQFWSGGDTGGSKTSWNEYASKARSYTPLFLTRDTAHSSLHWEAAGEGVADYEYLAMLRAAASVPRNAKLKARALALLAEAERTMTENYSPNYAWDESIQLANQFHIKDEKKLTAQKHDPAVADIYRLKILNLLEEMKS